MSRKQIIDAFLSIYISKKLIVFIIASIGLFANVIPASDWVTIAAVYIGTQGAIDAIEKLKK